MYRINSDSNQSSIIHSYGAFFFLNCKIKNIIIFRKKTEHVLFNILLNNRLLPIIYGLEV